MPPFEDAPGRRFGEEVRPACGCRASAPCPCVPARASGQGTKPACGCRTGGACACVPAREGYRRTIEHGVTIELPPRPPVVETPVPRTRTRRTRADETRFHEDCQSPWALLSQQMEASGVGPTDPEDMPRVSRPTNLDWGDEPLQSAVVRDDPPNDPLDYFTRNRRFVYWLKAAVGRPPEVGGPPPHVHARYLIPKCWPDGRRVALGRGLAYLASPSGDLLVSPAGRYGEEGLAVLDLSTGAWERIDAQPDEPDLLLNCHARHEDFFVDVIATAHFVFVLRGGLAGVSVYRRPTPDEPQFRYAGVLGFPWWLGGTPYVMQPRALVTFQTASLAKGGTDLLLVGVEVTLQAPANTLPRVLIFDVGDPVEVETALQGAACGPDALRPEQPSSFPCGLPLIRGLVATRAWPRAATPNERRVTELAVRRLPDTTTPGRPVLFVASTYTVDAIDLSGLLGEGDAANDPRGVERTHDALPEVLADVPVQAAVLDTFALSSGPCSNACGPPRWMQAPAKHPDLVAFGGGGLVVSDRYAAVGWGTRGAAPSAALHLLALAYSVPDLSDFRLRLAGTLAPDLTNVQQFETMSPFHAVRGWPGSGDWIVGSARTMFGLVGFQLPPQARANELADWVEGELPWQPGPAVLFPTTNECECPPHGPDVPATAAYETGGSSEIAAQYVRRCWTIGPLLCPDDQFPANEHDGLRITGPPSPLGFGHEFLGGIALARRRGGTLQEALVFADRGSEALWAYDADPEEAPLLRARGVGFPPSSIAELPWDDDPDWRLLVAVSSASGALLLTRWTWPDPTSPLMEDPLVPLLAYVPTWDGGTARPTRLERVCAFPESDSGSTAPTLVAAGVSGIRLDSGSLNRFEGFDLLLADLGSLPSQLSALTAQAASPLDPVEASDLSWPGPVPETVFFRFRRDCHATGVWTTRIEGPSVSLDVPGAVRVVDQVHHDRWLFALVQAPGAIDNEGELIEGLWEFFLVTFEVDTIDHSVTPGSWCSGPGITAEEGNIGPIGALGLHVVEVTELRTPTPSTTTEPKRLFKSPQGDYLMAMGEAKAGCWLIRVDYEFAGPGVAPAVEVVAGLRKAGATWFRWDSDPTTSGLVRRLEDPTQAPFDERDLDRYPVWPISDVDEPPSQDPNVTYPCDWRFGVDVPGEQRFPWAQSVTFPGQAAAFSQSDDGELFLFLNTNPLSAWRINRDRPDSDPWTYLGALCVEGRLRAAPLTHSHAWFVGNDGAFAVPICSEHPHVTGCCPFTEL